MRDGVSPQLPIKRLRKPPRFARRRFPAASKTTRPTNASAPRIWAGDANRRIPVCRPCVVGGLSAVSARVWIGQLGGESTRDLVGWLRSAANELRSSTANGSQKHAILEAVALFTLDQNFDVTLCPTASGSF